jgi:hypothetical protein
MLAHAPSLTSLSICNQPLRVAGMRELTSQLGSSPALRTLYVKSVALGDEGVGALGGVLKGATKLKSVDIRGNGASEAAVAAFQTRVKEARGVYEAALHAFVKPQRMEQKKARR